MLHGDVDSGFVLDGALADDAAAPDGADAMDAAEAQLSDAATAFHLVAAGGELYKNESGVMTAVSARDRLTMTAADDTLHSWAVGNDRYLFTNGTDIAKKFYSFGGAEYYENESIAKPTANLTLGASGAAATLVVVEGCGYS